MKVLKIGAVPAAFSLRTNPVSAAVVPGCKTPGVVKKPGVALPATNALPLGSTAMAWLVAFGTYVEYASVFPAGPSLVMNVAPPAIAFCHAVVVTGKLLLAVCP